MTHKTLHPSVTTKTPQQLPDERAFRDSAKAILTQCRQLRAIGDYPSAQRLGATLFEVLVRHEYRKSVGKLQSGLTVADVVQHARTQKAIDKDTMRRWRRALTVNHLRVGTASTFVADKMLEMCGNMVGEPAE